MRIVDANGISVLLRGTLSDRSSATGLLVAKRKDISHSFVESLGITLPPALLHDDLHTSRKFLEAHKLIIVKPADSLQSKGVTTDISTEDELLAAIKTACKHSKSNKVILQKQLEGNLYRLLVLDGKFVAAALRRAPKVTGDGISTTQQLVAQLNRDPRRSATNSTPLKFIDEKLTEVYLGSNKYKSVLAKGELLQVSPLDSISAGGEAANVTDQVHPAFVKLTEQIAKALSLFICGFDVICPDIAVTSADNYLPMLELNSMPGLKLHHFPTAGGDPIDVAGMMIDKLFC